MEESFDLDGRFCDDDDDDDDDDDLETSWQKQKLFSNLINIQKSLILADSVFNETHLQLPDFVEDDIDTDRKNENIKFTKQTSLYQIIYYILHARKKKTPFHMMTAHAIYDKCKSRELVTILIILNNASPKSKRELA